MHVQEITCSVRNHEEAVPCTSCDLAAVQVLTAPLLVSVKADIGYDSPIDGTHITSWHARQEDLKRHECIEYDPGMKQDYQRRITDGEQALDRQVDAFVEEKIERMSTAERQRLHTALVEQSSSTEIVRH
ncbi:MAG: hypothetical protein VW518_00830 [Burkholderiaceae bacterium]